MPWHIVKEDNKYIVRNIDTGRLLGTHKTYKSALKQLRLLYYLVSQGKIKETKGGSTFYGDGIDKKDIIYLALAEESYKPKEERSLIVDEYLYDIDLSTKRTAVYVNPINKDIIIAHRGTKFNDSSDLKQDLLILSGNIAKSDRLKRSLQTVEEVMMKYPTFLISNTGHSLGSQISSQIWLKLPIKDSKVVGFNTGASPIDIGKNIFNSLKCKISNSDACKKLKNQKFYSTGIDPLSLSHITHTGKQKFVLTKSFNVHSLKNFRD